mgnify:CR=1 FL=1
MNKKELKKKLDLLEINENDYSLEGNYIPDSIILINLGSKQEVFYFDEKGNKNNEKIFIDEEKAYNYIYDLFIEAKKIERKYLS